MLHSKPALRSFLARTLYASGMSAPHFQQKGKLCVVTFHRVLPASARATYPYPGLVVTPEDLDALLRFLSEHFDCGTLATQYSRFREQRETVKPLLAVTFDDGQFDNLRYAQPVLDRHGIKATFFIPVRAVLDQQLLWHDQLGLSLQHLIKSPAGQQLAQSQLAAAGVNVTTTPDGLLVAAVRGAKKIPLSRRLRLVESLLAACGGLVPPDDLRMLTAAEVSLLAVEGHEIGSHSMTHCLMPECDDASLQFETAASRGHLEQISGTSVQSFCYPNGDADARCAAAVADAGYTCAVTTQHGANTRSAIPFRLSRFDMDAARMKNPAGEITDHDIAFRLARR